MNPELLLAAQSAGRKTNLFVQSLYDLVSNSPEDVIGFSPQGTSFEIRNANTLCDVVLSKYFKHKNLSSFFRQLNLYGFSKLPLKNSGHAFHHEFFVRGRPDLLVNVTRVKTSGKRNCASPSKEAEDVAAAGATTATAVDDAEEMADEQEPMASPPPTAETCAANSNNTQRKRVKRSAKPTSFLNAAFQIASMENSIAGFNETGTCLEIRDEVAFTTETLPKFFKHGNLSSFVRQLNQYGFEKAASSSAAVAHTFYHPCFRRGDLEALGEIARRSKGLVTTPPTAATAASAASAPSPAKQQRALPAPPPSMPLPPAPLSQEQPALLPPLPVSSVPYPSFAAAAEKMEGKIRRKPLAFVSGTFALCSLENEAIGFSADGTCLEIRNENLLVETHLETCFKHRNLTSFFRQLNMYGFYKRESPPNVSHTYMHENFRRGREDLLVLIKRRHVKHALPVLEPEASFAAAELSSLRRHSVSSPSASAPRLLTVGNPAATTTTTTAAAPRPMTAAAAARLDQDLLSGLLALVEKRDVTASQATTSEDSE